MPYLAYQFLNIENLPSPYNNNILRLFYKEFPGQEVMPTEAEVYTLSPNSWRTVVTSVESLRGSRPNGSVDYINGSCGLFFNGALHFIACSQDMDHKLILSFDVNDDRFREILLPQNYLDGDDQCFECLAMFKGLLIAGFD